MPKPTLSTISPEMKANFKLIVESLIDGAFLDRCTVEEQKVIHQARVARQTTVTKVEVDPDSRQVTVTVKMPEWFRIV